MLPDDSKTNSVTRNTDIADEKLKVYIRSSDSTSSMSLPNRYLFVHSLMAVTRDIFYPIIFLIKRKTGCRKLIIVKAIMNQTAALIAKSCVEKQIFLNVSFIFPPQEL